MNREIHLQALEPWTKILISKEIGLAIKETNAQTKAVKDHDRYTHLYLYGKGFAEVEKHISWIKYGKNRMYICI